MPSKSCGGDTNLLIVALFSSELGEEGGKPEQELADAPPHLDGVVQRRAGRVQRQVLEGLDLRRLPAAALGPVDGQHVVGELLPEQEAGGVGLGLARRAALHHEVGRLGAAGERASGRREREEEEAGGTEQSGATDTSDRFFNEGCY